MERLVTRSELNAQLAIIRRNFNVGFYIVMIVIALINIWWALLLFIPLWMVMAAAYTAVDNKIEGEYIDAVLKRKKEMNR